MKINRIIDEYDRLEKKRRLNLKKSVNNMKAHFQHLGIVAKDFEFKMNIDGSFHSLNLRQGPIGSSKALGQMRKTAERFKRTICRIEGCHPMFYGRRICIAFTFSNVEKLCKLSEQLGCWLDNECEFFYSIDSEVIFFFTLLSKNE